MPVEPIGAAAGSIASQGLGVATGLQDRFSWTGVALAGLSSGIGAGLSGTFDGLSSSAVVRGALEGAAGNALTQGVGVVTGLQRRFDWTGVAVGAAVGGVTGGLGEALGVRPGIVSAGNVARQAATGMAGAIAGAATRSLLDGTDFGDNVLATLPDVIGSTIGNLVADSIAGTANRRSAVSPVELGDMSDLLGDDTVLSGAEAIASGTAEVPQLGEGGGQVGGAAATTTLGTSSSDSLAKIGYIPSQPRTREENDAQTRATEQSIIARADLSDIQKDKALTELYNRSSYWDSMLPSASMMVGALGVSYDSGTLTVGGPNGLVVGNGEFSLGGPDGVDITRGGLRIGGFNGIDVSNQGIRIGGINGIDISQNGVSVGGRSGIILTNDAFSLGGYTLVGDLGPGVWRVNNESHSERATAYEAQITGRSGQSYVVNGVKFDGFRAGTLLEAKGPGYMKFMKEGKFISFLRVETGLLDQAQRQVRAANGTPIIWHVAEAPAADAMRALFSRNQVTGIEVVNTPVRP